MTQPNETTSTEATTEEAQPQEGATTEETTTEETPTEEQAPEASPEDDLPEWARKELTKTRAEAANYRTRLRDAETRLSEAKTPEEFEAALNEVKAKNEELERSVQVGNAARKYNLPDDLAEELAYLPLDKIEERAKVLSKYVTAPPPASLSGGLTPDDGDDGENDPRKLAQLTRRF